MREITDKHEIERVQAELLPRLINDWALLTAGEVDHYNAMTIAWGSMGDMWWMPVFDAYVVPTRYTYGFMEDGDWFTVSFYDASHKHDLEVMGSVSGRDSDKVAQTSLTPLTLEHGVTFEEAEVTLVCRKLYGQPLERDMLPAEIVDQYYTEMPPHAHFVGQIVKVIER